MELDSGHHGPPIVAYRGHVSDVIIDRQIGPKRAQVKIVLTQSAAAVQYRYRTRAPRRAGYRVNELERDAIAPRHEVERRGRPDPRIDVEQSMEPQLVDHL